MDTMSGGLIGGPISEGLRFIEVVSMRRELGKEEVQ